MRWGPLLVALAILSGCTGPSDPNRATPFSDVLFISMTNASTPSATNPLGLLAMHFHVAVSNATLSSFVQPEIPPPPFFKADATLDPQSTMGWRVSLPASGLYRIAMTWETTPVALMAGSGIEGVGTATCPHAGPIKAQGVAQIVESVPAPRWAWHLDSECLVAS